MERIYTCIRAHIVYIWWKWLERLSCNFESLLTNYIRGLHKPEPWRIYTCARVHLIYAPCNYQSSRSLVLRRSRRLTGDWWYHTLSIFCVKWMVQCMHAFDLFLCGHFTLLSCKAVQNEGKGGYLHQVCLQALEFLSAYFPSGPKLVPRAPSGSQFEGWPSVFVGERASIPQSPWQDECPPWRWDQSRSSQTQWWSLSYSLIRMGPKDFDLSKFTLFLNMQCLKNKGFQMTSPTWPPVCLGSRRARYPSASRLKFEDSNFYF